MTQNALDEYARANPFRPFEIRMIDGTSYRVSRMEAPMVMRSFFVVRAVRHVNLSLVESVGYGRTRPRRRPTG